MSKATMPANFLLIREGPIWLGNTEEKRSIGIAEYKGKNFPFLHVHINKLESSRGRCYKVTRQEIFRSPRKQITKKGNVTLKLLYIADLDDISAETGGGCTLLTRS